MGIWTSPVPYVRPPLDYNLQLFFINLGYLKFIISDILIYLQINRNLTSNANTLAFKICW
jgi:hypothetical protein